MVLELSKQAFWDVNLEDIKGNEKEHANWIIKRIAKYGTVDDMVSIGVYYGHEKIKEVIGSMSPMERERTSLMEAFLGI